MTYTFEQRKDVYAHAWHAMEINPNRLDQMQHAAKTIIAGRARYEPIAAKSGVPWYIIGLFHYRESSCDFGTHLHNGDSLKSRTHHEPAGRPVNGHPPFTFEESALDALKLEGFTRFNWDSVERIAYASETMNGFGYAFRGLPSAYLWAGTNQYRRGKFVRDGQFDPTVVDVQCGVMGVLYVIEQIEPGTLPGTVVAKVDTEKTYKAPAGPVTHKEAHQDLAQHSAKYSLLERIKIFLGIGVGASGVAKVAADSAPHSSFMSSFGHYVQAHSLELLILGLITAAFIVLVLQHRQREDVMAGRAVPSGRA